MESERIETLQRPLSGSFVRAFGLIRAFLGKVRRRERRLCICETLPLGEKRFLAIVQIEGRRLLIGATHHSISVLERLDSPVVPRPKPDPTLANTYLSGVN
jgi:flagellar biogenesis protein FliO